MVGEILGEGSVGHCVWGPGILSSASVNSKFISSSVSKPLKGSSSRGTLSSGNDDLWKMEISGTKSQESDGALRTERRLISFCFFSPCLKKKSATIMVLLLLFLFFSIFTSRTTPQRSFVFA